MQKILTAFICTVAICPAFATGENIATSKAFVDTAVAQKQDTIPANDGAPQVLTNTGTPGTVGTKNIYDASGSYAEQTDALVTAGDFNSAIQNAIDAEFECIAWRDPNDHNSDCMLVNIVIPTNTQNLLSPANIHQGTIWGANDIIGRVGYRTNRCYFDYMPVHAGDVVNITSKIDTPPVYFYIWLYNQPSETEYNRMIPGSQITIGDHIGYSWTMPADGYIRGLWLQDENFTPDDVIEPMVEISQAPHEYVPYRVFLPNGD